MTLQAAILIWDGQIVRKLLEFAKDRGFKLVLEHDIIVKALGQILNSN